MTTLSPELAKQIEQEAEHYANVQHSDDDSKDDWGAGAEHYALKWEQAEAMVEKMKEALEEMLKQHTYYDVIELAANTLADYNTYKNGKDGE
jgi:hypothetical protein